MKPTWLMPKSILRSQRPARGLPLANNQGLTLIECLVAIVMVALVSSAITPALVISVATRVQSQRAEQALRIAQSEIDRVRLLAEQSQPDPNDADLRQTRLVEVTRANSATFVPIAPAALTEATVDTQPGPARGAPVARTALANVNQTFRQELGGNDFAVQVYRTQGLVRNGEPLAFAVGVRVYDISAVESAGAGNLSNEPLSLAVRGGEGQRRERPLAALYTTVAVSERGGSLCDFILFTDTGGNAVTPTGCLP